MDPLKAGWIAVGAAAVGVLGTFGALTLQGGEPETVRIAPAAEQRVVATTLAPIPTTAATTVPPLTVKPSSPVSSAAAVRVAPSTTQAPATVKTVTPKQTEAKAPPPPTTTGQDRPPPPLVIVETVKPAEPLIP